MFDATTILAVRDDEKIVIAGDGQVTLGNTVMKAHARKVRRISKEDVIAGFAGSAADAFTLFARFEEILDKHNGQLARSAIELAKQWRSDKYLRKLEALLTVADKEITLVISGTGDIIEPDEPCVGIGSGGAYAQAAALALLRHSKHDAKTIACEAMKIAGEICIYTNQNIVFEEIDLKRKKISEQ